MNLCGALRLSPMNEKAFCYNDLILRARSSGVEHSPFKRGVVGSNPTGLKFFASIV